MVAPLVDALPSGSYVVVTHPTADFNPEAMAGAVAAAEHGGVTLVPRSREETAAFFTGLDLVEPGVVPVLAWRPDPGPRPIRTVRITTPVLAASHNAPGPFRSTRSPGAAGAGYVPFGVARPSPEPPLRFAPCRGISPAHGRSPGRRPGLASRYERLSVGRRVGRAGRRAARCGTRPESRSPPRIRSICWSRS